MFRANQPADSRMQGRERLLATIKNSEINCIRYLTKDPAVWEALVPLYRSNVLPTDAALARAGMKVTRRDGQSYITMKGMQMTVQQAAKSGLI